MKIFKTLPERGENLKHDAPLLNVVRFALPAFIFISSVTVFMGVKSHIGQWMLDTNPIWGGFGYGIGYVFFSLAPDLLNAIAVAYIARSIIKGHYQDKSCLFLMLFCSILVFPLTRYSFKMSLVSAKAVVDDHAKEKPKAETAKLDANFQGELKRVSDAYTSERSSVEAQYDQQVAAKVYGYDQKMKAYEESIAAYERSRKATNTQWVDKKQKDLRNLIAETATERSKVESELLTEKGTMLEGLLQRKKDSEDLARDLLLQDRDREIGSSEETGLKIEEVTSVLKKQLSGISGYAVFVVILLTIVLQILEHRNGVEYEFEFTLWDGGINPFREVVGLPLTALGRTLINRTRKGYAGLEKMSEPVPSLVRYNMPIPDADDLVEMQVNGTVNHPETKGEKRKKKDDTPVRQPINLLAGLRNMLTPNGNDSNNLKAKKSANDLHAENGPYENRIDDSKVIIVKSENFKTCEHCGTDYSSNHKKQKFCSSDCRKASWEERTKRTLKLKPKKK